MYTIVQVEHTPPLPLPLSLPLPLPLSLSLSLSRSLSLSLSLSPSPSPAPSPSPSLPLLYQDQEKMASRDSVQRQNSLCQELRTALRSMRLSDEVKRAEMSKLRSELQVRRETFWSGNSYHSFSNGVVYICYEFSDGVCVCVCVCACVRACVRACVSASVGDRALVRCVSAFFTIRVQISVHVLCI